MRLIPIRIIKSRCVQIAWQLHDAMGNLIDQQDYIVQPEGFDIPYVSE